jgi:hypothetical protein
MKNFRQIIVLLAVSTKLAAINFPCEKPGLINRFSSKVVPVTIYKSISEMLPASSKHTLLLPGRQSNALKY